MTTSEDWSLQFDLLYNNISSNQAPGLTEYEKSVFLTQAQEAVILDLYKGLTGDSFETTEEVTRYLNSLVKSDSETLTQASSSLYNQKVYTVSIEENVWFIIFESVINSIKNTIPVIPTRHDSLHKDLKNPFRGPSRNRVLRTSEDNKVCLYSSEVITTYNYKYIKRPYPIVLEGSELEVNGVSDFDIEVPESLHNSILMRAVQMAKTVWQM